MVEKELGRLNQDPGLRIEVINTGTTSYSPMIEYVLARHVLADYSPDLLVVQVDMTDDFDDWKYRQTAVWDRDGNPWAVPPRDIYQSLWVETGSGVHKAGWFAKAQLFLLNNSSAYNWLRSRNLPGTLPSAAEGDQWDPLAAVPDASGDLYQRWSWCKHDWDALTEKNVNSTLDVLRRLAQWSRSQGIKLMLTGVPHYPQCRINEDGRPFWSLRPHEELARVAQESGAAWFDSPAWVCPVVGSTAQREYYYNGDMHFNPRGYRLWAQGQSAFLADPAYRLLPDTFYKRPE